MTRPALLTLTLLTACSRSADNAPSPTPAPVTVPASAPRADDSLDTRTPLPLLPMMANHQKQNMRDHLAAVQEIVAALGSDDFAGIEKAASRIGYSPHMGQMCTHMGAGAPGFTEQALGFHHTADRLIEAAAQKDRKRVIAALSATLETCTACHATWKQQIVDEPTWARLTASPVPPAHDLPH